MTTGIWIASLAVVATSTVAQPLTSPYIVSAADFRDDGGTTAFFFDNQGAQFLLDEFAACITAPLALPDGASIENFFVFAFDEASDTDFSMTLYRKNIFSTAPDAEVLGIVATSGSSPNMQIIGDTSIVNGVVDNSQYHYYIAGCMTRFVDHRVYASWIHWLPPGE